MISQDVQNALDDLGNYSTLFGASNSEVEEGVSEEAKEWLIEYIAKLEAENAALKERMRWIPVNENLPADDVYVLILEDGRGIYFACYKEKIPQWESIEGFFWHGDMLQNITHWMPLPDAPEEP